MKLLPNKPQKECCTTKRWAQKCFNTATRTGWTIYHQSTQQHRSAIIFSNLLQCQQSFVKFITRCMISCGFWKPLQLENYKFSLFRGLGELKIFVISCNGKIKNFHSISKETKSGGYFSNELTGVIQAKMNKGADDNPKSHLHPCVGATANASATSKHAPSAQKH